MSKAPVIRLLGRVEVEGEQDRPLSPKARALLCLLARTPGKPVPRARLADMLWSTRDEPRARANLRQTLRQLRVALGGELVRNESDDVLLAPEAPVDLARLENAARSHEAEEILAAANLFDGDFAADLSIDGEPVEVWFSAERAQIREIAADLTLRAVDLLREAGDFPRARILAMKFLRTDPLHEPIRRALIEVLVRLGRRGAAIEQYRELRDLLAAELDARPDDDTERLFRDLLDAGPTRVSERPGEPKTPDTGFDPAGAPAIAVLPIEDGNPDARLAPFARGLAEELIVSLSGWRRFPVVSPASSLIGSREPLDHLALGRRLNARYLVVSKIHSGARRARMTSRLVASDTGVDIWGGSYEIDLNDPLAAQEELAGSIAGIVLRQAESSELQRIVWKRTSELEAWEYQVLGQRELQRFSRTGNLAARECFAAALEIDPDYAAAYVGMSTSHCWDLQYANAQERPHLLDLAEQCAMRALAIDWNSPLAHTRLGAVYTWREDFGRGLAESELALHLNPSETGTRLAFGNRLDLVGRTEEGIRHLELGLRLNPLDPRSGLYMGYLARAYLSLGRPDAGLVWAQRGAALRPNDPEMYLRLAACSANLDDRGAAEAALRSSEKLEAGFLARKRGWVPYSDGHRNDAFFEGLRRFDLL